MRSRASSASSRDNQRGPSIWPIRTENTASGRRWRIYWRRLAVWSLGLFILGWIGAAAGAYHFIKHRRGFTDVRFSHILLLPFKHDDYQRAKGEFWIREGMAATERNEWRKAFDLLRAGLPAVPEDKDARITVARIYLMAGRPDQASDVLIEGLPHIADQLDYARSVIGFLFSQQADETIVNVCTKLLPLQTKRSPLHGLFVGAKMIALFNRDQFAEAKAFIASEGIESAPQARLVLARIAWDEGREAEALAALRALVEQNPADAEAYQTLVSYLRQSSRHGEIRRLSVSRQLLLPDEAAAYLDFLQACADEQDRPRLDQAEADFLVQFHDNPSALLQLTEYAARNGRHSIALSVLERARALGKEEASATLHLVSAYLEAGLYSAALATVDASLHETDGWNEVQKIYRQGLRMVALAGAGKGVEADASFVPILESRYLTANVATALALRLVAVRRPDAARKLLQRAVEIDPLYQPALVQLLRTEMETKDLAELLPIIQRFVMLRKPPVDILRDLRAEFESDRYLFLPDRTTWVSRLATRRAR